MEAGGHTNIKDFVEQVMNGDVSALCDDCIDMLHSKIYEDVY